MGTHPFQFFRAGGVDQVLLRDGSDLAHLPELDQKLWMALAMPIKGVEFDPRTATLLDTDKDGRLRPPEILAAVAWAAKSFKSLEPLFAGGDVVQLSNIADPEIRACAERTLASLKKSGAAAIALADVSDTASVFAGTVLNGDGIIIPDSATQPEARQVIEDLLSVIDPVPDRSGKPGLDQARIDAFFAEAEAYEAWAKRGESEPDLRPIGATTPEAVAAVQALRAKINDYFARCRLAGFDPASGGAVGGSKELAALSAHELGGSAPEVKALPLARIEAGRPLAFDAGINPAWATEAAAFQSKVMPLLPGVTAMTEVDWATLQAKLAQAEAWQASRPAARVEKLGRPRLSQLLASNQKTALTELVAQDRALEKEFSQLESLEKLVRLQRDLLKLLTNFVSFADFYGRKGSTFQVGTLYLDARSCELCIDVADSAKHAALAALSAAYVAYCDITRPGEAKRSIAAIFTNGDSTNLMVGRAGVFYDRAGRDWDATITRIVSNPISLREAFWLPYQKLVRMVDEQITKRAQAADAAANAKVSTVATEVANADQTKAAAAPAPAKAPDAKPLDLGAIALVGTAIGGVSALVGGFLNALFGLGMWMPLGIGGIILLISGPSMLLAWLKLRQRNLGPLLDANGWAINTSAKLNAPLGAALTRLASPPKGALISTSDPFAEKKRPWKLYLSVAAVLALGYGWLIGRLDNYLPPPIRAAAVLHLPAPAAH